MNTRATAVPVRRKQKPAAAWGAARKHFLIQGWTAVAAGSLVSQQPACSAASAVRVRAAPTAVTETQRALVSAKLVVGTSKIRNARRHAMYMCILRAQTSAHNMWNEDTKRTHGWLCLRDPVGTKPISLLSFFSFFIFFIFSYLFLSFVIFFLLWPSALLHRLGAAIFSKSVLSLLSFAIFRPR